MLRKIIGATVVATAALALAVPAQATAAVRTAKFSHHGGTATLGFDAVRHVWHGNVAVTDGVLAPGDYAYTVLFEKVNTPYGVAPGIGDFICKFRVTTSGHAKPCKGESRNLTDDGTWGRTNVAQVTPLSGGDPVLSANFKG